MSAIDGEEAIEGALGDVKRRQVGKEVIAHQKGHEHEVVNHSLKRHRHLRNNVKGLCVGS